MKEWRKIRLWILMGPLLPFLYGSAILHRKHNFNKQFYSLQWWCKIIVALSFTKLHVKHDQTISTKQGMLVVSNHQGSMDPFVIAATMPTPTTAVTKVENLKVPVLGTWLKTLGAVSFNRESIKDSVRMLKDVSVLLQTPRNVVIFPEGTRSRSNTMGEFKAGALKAAYLAKTDIMVVALVNTHTIMDEVGTRRQTVHVIYDGVIAYEDFQHKSTVELAAQIKQRIESRILQYTKEDIR